MTTVTKRLVLISCLLLAFGRMAAQEMKVHIIDVGQGSAALLEFPCGVMMIDTGGEKNDEFHSTDSLMKYLQTFFTRRSDLNNTIDLLMISHPHKDHTLGVKSVIAKYKVKNVVTNGQITGSGKSGQLALHRLVADRENTTSTADDIGYFESLASTIPNGGITNAIIDPINCAGGNPVIKVLWGQLKANPGWTKDDFDDENNHSVVCRIDYGQSSILFTGDLEIAAIRSLMTKHTGLGVFDADVYVAGHHGSVNGTTAPFVQAISPEMAVLSFGDPDRQLSWTAFAHGHPNRGIIGILTDNVTGTRPAKDVLVGDGAETFVRQEITKAVYGVGWDGTINLTATLTGAWTVNEAKPLININTATVAELQKLPSIGATRAQAIITHRTAHAFTSVDQLDDVPGIGPATVNLLRPLVKI